MIIDIWVALRPRWGANRFADGSGYIVRAHRLALTIKRHKGVSRRRS